MSNLEIGNRCNAINPWNYQVTKTTKSVAWSAVVFGILATTVGVLGLLASSGVPMGAFNCLGSLQLGGGIALTALGGAFSVLGAYWLFSKLTIQPPIEHQPQADLSSLAVPLFSCRESGQSADFALPGHVSLEILTYLPKQISDIGTYRSVCKAWNTAFENGLKEIIYPSIAFGKAHWKKYIGDIGEEPPLPSNIHEILQSPCPFWEGKRVRDTHLLVLIPTMVDGEELNIGKLDELANNPKNGGNPTHISTPLQGQSIQQFQGAMADRPYWVLVTKEEIPNSKFNTFPKQIAILEEQGYTHPISIEFTISLLTHYIRSGEKLYSTNQSFCKDLVNNQYIMDFGNYGSNGLEGIYHDVNRMGSWLGKWGMAGVRRLGDYPEELSAYPAINWPQRPTISFKGSGVVRRN